MDEFHKIRILFEKLNSPLLGANRYNSALLIPLLTAEILIDALGIEPDYPLHGSDEEPGSRVRVAWMTGTPKGVMAKARPTQEGTP